jgi:predicted dinucleotide-binding enzyme
VFGVRRPEDGLEAIKGSSTLSSSARITTTADAVRGAQVVVVATPWAATAAVLQEAGPLEGITLLDATNPLGPGFSLLHGPAGESGAEQVQALVPKAHVVKVFNTTGYDNMQDPVYDGAPTLMLYAGNDAGAKHHAHQLATDLGFDAVDAGALVRARQLEHQAVLWISLAYGGIGRNIAFRLVRR